jgi:Tfp pilus assembly protein PilO
MSNPAPTEKDTAATNARRTEPLRVRLEKLLGLNEQSIVGVPEIAALAASFVMLLAVFFAYFYSLTPARARLEDLQRKRTQLQARLRDSQDGVKRNTDTQSTVAEIGESLQNFEAHYLAGRTQGRTALIDGLNALIRRNNARVSTGFSFAALDAFEANNQTRASTKTAAKGQTSFPGVAVSVTVEGQYANLRHLIRDIEANNQFIIINAVELQSVTDVAASRVASVPFGGVTPGGTNAAGATPGAVAAARQTFVSLRIDMTDYFRRDASIINSSTTMSSKTTTTTIAPAARGTR